MDYSEQTRKDLIEKLCKNNLYLNVDEDTKDANEAMLIEFVQKVSANFEQCINSSRIGVDLEFVDVEIFSVKASIINGKYRGKITFSRLIIIAMYEMFYAMDYTNIVVDGKNIDIIKEMMFKWALFSILLHELAHIYRGHISLFKQWEMENTIDVHFLDIQTLEWDADSMAATNLARLINYFKKEVIPKDDTDFITKIMCGAIYGAMYWQRFIDDFEYINKKRHPAPIYRALTMIDCIGDLVENKEDILEYILGYENEFNRVFCFSDENIVNEWRNAYNNSDILFLYFERWDDLKKKLEEYSVIPLD